MSRRKPFLLLTTLAIGLLFALSARTGVTNAGAERSAVAGSLVGASANEIAHSAVEYTRNVFTVASGTPEVRLVRPVKASELASLGFGTSDYLKDDLPLAIVVLRGDFDLSRGALTRIDPSTWRSRVDYIAYVIDLRVGKPTMTRTQLEGMEVEDLVSASIPPDAAFPAAADAEKYQCCTIEPTIVPPAVR